MVRKPTDEIKEVTAVVERDAAVAKKPESGFEAKSVQVRSKLGEQLCELIRPDLPEFYKKIRDVALDKPGCCNGVFKKTKNYGPYQTAHRRMFMDLMKVANADMDVNTASAHGDMDDFRAQLSKLGTNELRALVEKAQEVAEDEYGNEEGA